MTLGLAWVRSIGRLTELMVASDSRLSGGRYWDANPKIMMLPRSDCVMSFAGDTDDAYPLMLQAYNAIAMFPEAANRSMDLMILKGRLVRIFNRSREVMSNVSCGMSSNAQFMLSGYSWREKKFCVWTLHYDDSIEKFTFRPSRPWRGKGQEQKLIAFVGDDDAILEAKRRLTERLREKERLLAGGLNMEPFEVLRDVIRSQKFASVGGAPQLVKLYEHMNAAPIEVYWPDRERGVRTLLGRPLLGNEKSQWGVLDPDLPDKRQSREE